MRKNRSRVYENRVVKDHYVMRVSTIQKRRARNRIRILLRCMRWVALAGLVAGAALGVRWAVQRATACVESDPAFTVSTVRVRNNWKYKADQIGRMADVLGQNIFRLDLDQVRSRLEGHVHIRRAVVSRRLPATVEIVVFEREPFAYVRGEQLFVVDEEGVVLDGPLSQAGDEHLPVILNLAPAAPHGGLRRVEAPAFGEIVQCLRCFYGSGMSSCLQVTQVVADPLNGVTLDLKSGNRIVFGQGEYEKKLKRLQLILDDLNRKRLNGASVDLRFNDVIVKLAGS